MESQSTANSSSAQSEQIKQNWSQITVGFWSNFEEGESIQGEIIGIETIDSDDGTQYAYSIQDKKGNIYHVGQTRAVQVLDQIYKRYKQVEVYIEFIEETASGAYNFDIHFDEESAVERDEILQNVLEGQ